MGNIELKSHRHSWSPALFFIHTLQKVQHYGQLLLAEILAWSFIPCFPLFSKFNLSSSPVVSTSWIYSLCYSPIMIDRYILYTFPITFKVYLVFSAWIVKLSVLTPVTLCFSFCVTPPPIHKGVAIFFHFCICATHLDVQTLLLFLHEVLMLLLFVFSPPFPFFRTVSVQVKTCIGLSIMYLYIQLLK